MQGRCGQFHHPFSQNIIALLIASLPSQSITRLSSFLLLANSKLDPRSRNDPEECCKRPLHLKHPYCDEIRIPDDDYFYRLFNVKCIDFVRAFPSPRAGCKLGSRAQFNTLTSVIDGNTVYGVKEEFTRKLRTGFGGLLRMNPVFAEYGLKDLLPLKLDFPDEGCTRPNKSMFVNCFFLPPTRRLMNFFLSFYPQVLL